MIHPDRPHPFYEESGQTQLLGVMVLSTAMLTAALFTLDRANRAQEFTIKSSRVVEMRSALEGAAQRVATLYRTEASCDPAITQQKLNFIQPDGTLNESTPPAGRLLEVTVNNRTYGVNFGALQPLPWNSAPTTDPSLDTATGAPTTYGTSQDAELELWTSVPNQGNSAGGGTRTSMRIVLINTCITKCHTPLPKSGKGLAGEVCLLSDIPAVANREARLAGEPALPSFPGLNVTSLPYAVQSRAAVTCTSTVNLNRTLGDIPISATYDSLPDDEDVIHGLDLAALSHYLTQGSESWLESVGVLNPSGATPSCADLNLDGGVNEMDLHLLQKYLRGYLFRIPTNPNSR